MSKSLSDLAGKAQNGDKTSYHNLLNELLPMARAYVRKRINNASEAEDIVQEILISIHRALPSFQESQPFKPWFYTICRFRTMDYLRGLYRLNAHETGLDDLSYFEDQSDDVTERMVQDEQVHIALEQLNEKQRKIVILMKVQGYSAAEVALELDMNLSAVKVAAHRAYKKMRDKLTDE